MKKLLNYLLLLVLALFTLNLQSCSDDDDDDDNTYSSVKGSWIEVSSNALGTANTVDTTDVYSQVYMIYDGNYTYSASYESGSWEIGRCTSTFADGKITDAEGNYYEVSVSGNKMTQSYYAGMVTVTFEKKALPAALQSMIDNGEYTEYSSMDFTED